MRRVLSLLLTLGVPALAPAANVFNSAPPMTNTNLPMPGTMVPPAAFTNGLASLQALKKTRPLAHRWAVGLESVPGAQTGAAATAVAQPNALDVRYWWSDRLGLDLIAAGNTSSEQAGTGVMAPLYSSSPGTATYGGGVGFHYNLSEPSHDLLSQLVVKVTGAQSAESVSGFSGKVDSTTLAVFVGAGFEAFVPGWDWLSVEASAGVTAKSQSLTPQAVAAAASSAASAPPPSAQTVSGVGFDGNGFAPFNVSVHIYF